MGFDLFIQWFEDGAPAPVSYQAVRAAFGPATGPDDEFGFPVTYGPTDDSFVYATPEPGGVVTHTPM